MGRIWPDKKSPVAGLVVVANEISRIAEGVFLKGDIYSKNDVRVDGSIEGIVYSQGRVVVGEKAVIKGPVLCSNIDLWGQVDGDLYASGTLVLKSSAKVNGDIHTNRIQVEMGAWMDGSCEMIEKDGFDKYVSSIIKTPVPATSRSGD